MNCQPHSHFEECASPCQPTCPFPEQQQICATVCVETCVCDKGYVLSAGVCVPEATCGCSYQGRYYKPGQRFWEGPGCGRLCECDTTLGTVVCNEASCADNEECSVVDGIRACRPTSFATCTAEGDPHYMTFDGRRFDFQGTCKYQLAALCVKKPYLEPFKVTVQNENRGNNLAVSITRTVIIEMYGVTIIISRENPNKIWLDGQLEDLPLQYSDDLWVSHSGQKAVVETAAGITITFDWHHRVSVTLPSKYQGAVCGLCGNYNENPNDDFNKPNGEAANTEVQLGESWRVGIVQGCLSVCQGPRCSRCDGSQKDVYKVEKYCGIIADKTGPFKECHSRINNAPYLEDCAFDACQYDGHHGSVCDAIEAYVSACQSAGVEVRPWRTYKFCPMLCPANSHYTLCATSCPATCASLTSVNCNRSCAETCECDDGFLLSGGACVPIKDCGCSYGGHYYQSGAVFYPDDKCLEKCVCGENGAVLCQRTRCRFGEMCKLVDGVRGCHPVGEAWCVASGDPHYQTFDGHRFDFQGTCVYILAKVCDDDEGQLTSFTVTQGNEKWGNGNVAVTKSVGVEVYGFVIYIQRGDSWKVKVNGEFVNLPSSLHDGRIQITQEGRNIIVRTDFGLRVQYDTVYHAEVIVPSTYWRRMCGLCGNYNRNRNYDFLLPNGKFTKDVDVFGKAWAVELPGFDCGGCGSQCPVCDRAKAAVLLKPDSCDKDALCDSIMAYALACQSAGVQIQQWRSDSFCQNSHYELCADTCRGTCAGLLKAVSCSENCFEGCQCDQGLVFDGDQCVSPSKCGCLHGDRYLKVGESVVDPQCQSTCVCQAPGIVKCEKTVCGSSEVCEVRDGVRDCHPTQGQCSIDKAAHLSTFDGLTGPMGDLGAFEVASLCDFTDARWFRVVVDVRRCGKGSLVVDAVYVFFTNYSIAVNGQQEVWVNGRKTSLPVELDFRVSLYVSENSVVIEKTSVLRVTFSLTREFRVIVDPTLTYKMCGACGNYNHDPKDDTTIAGSDEKTSTDLTTAVWSWRAGDFSRCGLKSFA
uniref:VWFD domain-containing protein n=1 Tax=Knipowitschia caucasica TaxID=637954 RepID=A0AAV2MDB6_KNICA